MYVHIQKALYGCLNSALFFYEKLVGDLEAHRFEINPYDPCVANNGIEGKQLTITWHVDDLKILHVDKKVVSDTILWLDFIYGKMHGNRGKRHKYLGMWMDYSKRGEVKISMEGYLRGVLDDFPEKITGRVETPEATHLFKVRSGEEQVILDKPRAQAFHHSVAQLLFTSMRCRKDIQTAVAFLTTRVRAPNGDDWKKLRCLLQYVKCTM